MKKIIAMLLLAAMLVSLFAGCAKDTTDDSKPSTKPDASKPTESSTPSDPSNPSNPSTPSDPSDPSNPDDPDGPWAEFETITIAEALTLCESYVDAPSTERYYIIATIKSIDNDNYGQMTLTDETGEIMVYGSANADGSVGYKDMETKPKAGDLVLIYGDLQNYKGNTKEINKGWIIDWIANETPDVPVELPADGSELTIADILAMPVPVGETTTQHYIVRATVESISNAAYGAMWITDGKDSISVYNSKNADGSKGYADMEDKPYKGDTVVLKCTVQNFNGTMEIKQAYILEFTHTEIEINPSEYKEMTIAEARKAATGTKLTVTGVVARITFANGYKPSGVVLVDGTSSIYVYDGDLAARCAIGNTIKVAASKTYWILESESGNAQKFGYKGCNQLESPVLLELDESVKEFDKSWITESTVKEILDTPVTEDVTTLIFKVTAIINKQEGKGFVNYYINDLDGQTGSYTYTQCSGGDFDWLDKYDGKVCTVYLMALNAKSSSAGCTWRFLPVQVIDEGFNASSINVAEHVVKYYGVGQFLSSYTGNPALELLTSVDSDLLGFKGAALSYKSSDPSVISIDGNVMNCHKTGSVTITVTGSYNGKTYSEKVSIKVTINQQSATYPTVADAINANLGDTVTVQGIVGPSLVNQTGFYLIDKTGVIAVNIDADTLATLEIGYEVVLEARRAKNTKGGDDSLNGQTCLKDAKVIVNNYGKHEYSTESFKGEISVVDFYNLDINTDYTTSVYTMTATVTVEEAAYYTNIFLSDGTTSVRLYCSSANQYNWLKAYAGQTVTVEIAACNWNSKSYYTGCVLSVINADGTKTLNTLNFN